MLQLPKYLMKTDTFLNWSIRNYYFLSLCLESSDWIWVKILSKFNILSSISYFIFSSYFFYKLWLEKNIFIGAWGSTRKGKKDLHYNFINWLSVVQNNFLCILFLAVWGWSSVWQCYNLWHLCCSWQDSVSRQRSLVSALIFTLTLVLNFLLSKCRLTDLQKIDNFKNGGTFQIFSFWILDIHKK